MRFKTKTRGVLRAVMGCFLAAGVGGCVTVLPAPPRVNVTPLNLILAPGQDKQDKVLAVMGQRPQVVVSGIRLNADGSVPAARAAGLDRQLCVFPEMSVFSSVTIWQYTDVVLHTRESGPNVERDVCFVFLHTGHLLRLNERVTQ